MLVAHQSFSRPKHPSRSKSKKQPKEGVFGRIKREHLDGHPAGHPRAIAMIRVDVQCQRPKHWKRTSMRARTFKKLGQ